MELSCSMCCRVFRRLQTGSAGIPAGCFPPGCFSKMDVPHGRKNLRIRARDQNILASVLVPQHGAHNLCHLLGSLAFAEDYFGVALPECAMMIHFGEIQILEG